MANDYERQLQKALDKSESLFEKNLVYISSGALALSLTFLKDGIGANHGKFLLIFSWSFFSVSLLVDLFSDIIASNLIRKMIWKLSEAKEEGGEYYVTNACVGLYKVDSPDDESATYWSVYRFVS